jgi:hypothetical protein
MARPAHDRPSAPAGAGPLGGGAETERSTCFKAKAAAVEGLLLAPEEIAAVAARGEVHSQPDPCQVGACAARFLG